MMISCFLDGYKNTIEVSFAFLEETHQGIPPISMSVPRVNQIL
jgi:hypothetical protein